MPRLGQNDRFFEELTVPACMRRMVRGMTPFEEMRTIQRTPIIQINGSYDTSLLRDVIKTEGTANIESVLSEFELSTNAVGDKATMLSASRGRYVPGYAAEAGIGVRVPELPTGTSTIRAGYFDEKPGTQEINDGAVFGVDEGGYYVAIYRDGIEDMKTYAKDWNVTPSPDIDLSKGYILQIQFVYYGYGPVWFKFQDRETEQVTVLHKHVKEGEPTFSNSNLQVGSQVISEQDTSLSVFMSGRQFSILGSPVFKTRKVSHLVQGVDIPTTEYVPIMSFRRKVDRRAVPVQIQEFEALSDNDIVVQWRVGSTINATEWITPSSHNADEVAIEVNEDAATIDMNTGLKIDEDMVRGGDVGQTRGFAEGQNASDIPDEYTVTMCAKSIDGADAVATIIGKMVEER